MGLDLVTASRNIGADLKRNNITLPPNYSYENALRSAFLKLSQIKNNKGQYALSHCSENSIQAALLAMVLQGLNPGKDQCHFVMFGTNLTLIRGYLGSIMVAKSVDSNISKIKSITIYDGDEIKLQVINGMQIVSNHVQTINTINSRKVIAAYAMAFDHDKNMIDAEFMTWPDIVQAWRMSRNPPVTSSGKLDPDSVHAKFPHTMSEKSVINRLCKRLINTSDDSRLLAITAETDEELDIEDVIAKNGNQKFIDIAPPDASNDVEKEENTVEVVEVVDEVSMSVKQQIETIYGLQKELGRSEDSLRFASEYAGRDLVGLSELTSVEAESYIAALASELENIPKPDWK